MHKRSASRSDKQKIITSKSKFKPEYIKLSNIPTSINIKGFFDTSSNAVSATDIREVSSRIMKNK